MIFPNSVFQEKPGFRWEVPEEEPTIFLEPPGLALLSRVLFLGMSRLKLLGK